MVGGQTFIKSVDRTLTIKNPAPTLAPTVEDVNQATLALTGDKTVMVRYKSSAKVTTGAKAVKGASLKSQKVTCGAKSLSGNGTINGPESGDFTISATDSRGNTTTQTVKKTLVPYIIPTCYIGQGLPNALGQFDLDVSGDCFNGDFGAVENEITAEFRFAPKGTALGDDWMPMTVSPAGNGYTATAYIEGLDYRTTYIFQARVTDRLGTVESATKIVVSRALAEWGEDYWKFNVPVSIAEIDDAGEEHLYSILGAAKAMTTPYSMDVTMTKGANYSRVTGSAVLVGNQLRCYLNATRTSATPVGNITNEEVCGFTINHGGKIDLIYGVSFITGATGGIGAFQVMDITNGSLSSSFNLDLAATTTAMTSFNAYFVCPVTLNLDAFE